LDLKLVPPDDFHPLEKGNLKLTAPGQGSKPQMNTNETQIKTSVKICVHLWPKLLDLIGLCDQPARESVRS